MSELAIQRSIVHVCEYLHRAGNYCVLEAENPSLILGDEYILSDRRALRAPSADKVNIVLRSTGHSVVPKTELLDHLFQRLHLVTVVNDSGRKALTYVFASGL
mgnify:CR=1 FL=1